MRLWQEIVLMISVVVLHLHYQFCQFIRIVFGKSGIFYLHGIKTCSNSLSRHGLAASTSPCQYGSTNGLALVGNLLAASRNHLATNTIQLLMDRVPFYIVWNSVKVRRIDRGRDRSQNIQRTDQPQVSYFVYAKCYTVRERSLFSIVGSAYSKPLFY